ncbi:MAG: hypothetical protein ACTTKH_08170 [Treponema sp.]
MFNKNYQRQNPHNHKEPKEKDVAKPKRKMPNRGSRNSFRRQKPESYVKIEWSKIVCEKCGKEIKDLTLALSDKNTGNPVHFDCILSFIKNSEELKENEEIIYIGHGNFAIVSFENPKIRKKFKIVKLIEWEEKNEDCQWKNEIKKLASST